jgi:hypothetical protein
VVSLQSGPPGPAVTNATAVDDLDDPFLIETAVTSANTVHDKYQFESAFDFDLRAEAGEKIRRYEIDMYVFVPASIGINPKTYTREQFYTDLTSYMRLRTPQGAFGRSRVSQQLELPAADEYLTAHLSSRRRHQLAPRVVEEVKLFGCVVNTRLKELVSPMARQGSGTAVLQIEDLRVRLLEISELIEGYRNRYLVRLKTDPILIDEEVERAFLLVDEFLSARLDWIVIALRERFLTQGDVPPDLLVWLDVVLRHENAYRKETGLITLEDGPDRAQRLEAYYYRFGLLKKYVSEVLYVRVKQERRDSVYRNVIAGFCAGLAALWAALADLQRTRVVGRDSTLRLVAVIMVGVVAYIFKDRIKELSKEYFNERLKRFLPDYLTHMTYDHVRPDGERITTNMGAVWEFMRHLTREMLPPDVRYIREIENRSKLDPERSDVILHFGRQIQFRLEAIRSSLPRARHLKNVVRFDISEFLAKLDDPKQPLTFYDPEHGISHIAAPKVYHVNVVFRYSVERANPDGTTGAHVEYERIRVILNKKGIRRIETVLARGELAYEEESVSGFRR